MTQLTLFDAPVATNVPAPAVGSAQAAEPKATVSPRGAAVGGPQPIGNLAHLVLARYDMVARRRAQQRGARRRRHQPLPAVAVFS